MNLRFFLLSLVTFAGIALAPQLLAQAGNTNPGGPTAEFNGSITTAGNYDPFTGNARREITDIVVPGSIGAYPLKYTRTFATRGLGAAWTNDYTWVLKFYNPETNDCTDIGTCYDGIGRLTYPGGSIVDLWEPTDPGRWPLSDVNGRNGPDDLLIKCAVANSQCVEGAAAYELRRADGGKVLFSGKAYAIIDPYGQRTNLTYDASGRLSKVTEPGGRYLQFNYQNYQYLAENGTWVSVSLLGSVQAYAAPGNLIETVSYGYEGDWNTAGYVGMHAYYLTKAYYDDGAQATYTYKDSNMNTGGNMGNQTYYNVLDTCDDPRYAGPMKFIQYDYVHVSEAPNFVGHGQIKAEKNVAGQVVSRTTFPTSYNDPNLMRRTETRGDGRTRTIQYGPWSWTDFKNNTWSETSGPTGWTITDPRGNATQYHVEANIGALSKITFPQTDPTATPATKEYTFTNPAKPYHHSGVKDENGNSTFYDRDSANNRVTQIRYPDQTTEEFTYNGFGQVLDHKLKTGGWEHFRYDARGLKTLSWPPATDSDPNPEQHPTVYTYYGNEGNRPDRIDRLKTVTDPRGYTTTYDYNKRGQVTRVTHHGGAFTQSEYNLDGTLAWTADENHPWASSDPSQRTRYEYDEYKRVRKVTNPMEETTENWYGLDSAWQNPLLHTTSTVKYTLSPMGKNVVYAYDENLRKTHQVVAMSTADEACTTSEYDQVGNLTRTTDPRGNPTTFGYDARNRKIWLDSPIASDRNLNDHTMEWQYDGVGNKLKETRADNAFRSWEYDIPNRITRAVDWRMSLAEPPVITKYERNATGRVETITDPKLALYTSEFDELHRKTRQTYPPDVLQVNRYETWHYDIAGNLSAYRNRAGKTQTFAPYDNRNRPTSFSWNDDNVTSWQSFVFDPVGNVKELHNANADLVFTYDDANRKRSETQTIKSYSLNQIHTVTYDYDEDGNRYQLVYPVGLDYRHTYTGRNQLATVQLAWASTPSVQYAYDPAGNRSRRDTYFGAYTDYHHNPLNQLDWQASYFANGVARFDYGFDANHQIKYEQRDSGVADGFGYNTRNELTNFKQNGTLNPDGSVSAAYNLTMTYDPNGNRMLADEVSSQAHYATAPSNQYTSDWTGTLAYDDNENLTGRAGWTYQYDAQNRLVLIDGGNVYIRQHYDPLNRIVAWDINGDITTNVWDNWNLIEERTTGDALKRLYFWGAKPNEIVASYGPAYGDLFYFQDGRGNVTHLADPSNAVVERYTYFVSGQPNTTYSSGSSRDNQFLFGGARYLRDAEIYDMRNRFYHPNLGRFMQMDPIGLQTEGVKLTAGQKAFFSPGGVAPDAFTTSEINLYRYCGNDPVDNSDPLGLELDVIQSISRGTITVMDRDTGESYTVKGSTGTNNLADVRTQDVGPIPIGDYSIYERDGGMNGSRAWILDRNDSKRGNDTNDGKKAEKGDGRFAFRYHLEGAGPTKGSNGCPVSNKEAIDRFGHVADKTKKGPAQHITSPKEYPGDGKPRDDFGVQPRVGTWKVRR